MVQAFEASVTTWLLKMSSSSRRRSRLRSITVTCAPMPDGDFGCVRADDASADDAHIRRRDAGDAAQQNAAAAVGTLQILRADLHGQAPGDFAHGREQGQRPIGLDDGFVGDAVDFGFEKSVREFGQRREVQVGEKDQVGAEKGVFGGLGFLDLDDEVGALPDFGGVRNDGGAGVSVLFVGKRAAFARAGFDKHSWPASRRAAAPLGTSPTRVS